MAEQKGKYIDLELEDIKPDHGPSAKALLWILSIVLFLAIIIISTVLIAQAVKFEPFVLYDFYTDKTEYCPLEVVNITQEIEIKDNWWYTLGNLEGRLFMSQDGKPYLDARFDIPVELTPRDSYPSNTIRTAPPVPGTWVAAGEATLNGRMFGLIPVSQDIGVVETNEYTVLEWSDEQCNRRGL